MTILRELIADIHLLGLFALVAAFIISTRFYLYPNIISISKIKGLMDAPGERKMHSTQTPTLGGLGVFIAFSLTIIIFGAMSNLVQADLIKLLSLFGSLIILVFLGIKDDLISVSPKGKFLGQLVAVMNVVVLTDIRIENFEGLLGLGELPYLVSVVYSVFVFVLVINALNLIDGIDGLAASIAILSSTSFGVLFLINENYLMSLVSAILVGALIGFLRYNLSSNKKIFMGDCGSMLTGFLLAYQGIGFLTVNEIAQPLNKVPNAPVLLLAILSYPLFDLLRVFAIRIKQKRSPFSADSNHIHHRLLRLGLDHKKATLVLCLCNAAVIIFAILSISLNIHLALLATVVMGATLYLLPFLKVFELAGVEKLAEKVEVVVEDSVTKDTFEFNMKPLNYLQEGIKVDKKGAAEKENVTSTTGDTIQDQRREEIRKKRISNKRSAAFRKLAQKR
ncbi:MAG: MraY family glycosyltransferase [Maribacter sp.]